MKTYGMRWFALLGLVLFLGVAVAPSVVADDTTPPITTIFLDPAAPTGQNGWYVSLVEVQLIAEDNESGVNHSYYRINNETWEPYTEPFSMQDDGRWFIEYYSTDKAGNIEDIQSYFIRIDLSLPTIELYYSAVGGSSRDIYWRAQSNDDMSGIEYVDFLIDDVSQHKDYEPPYEWIQPWTGKPVIIQSIAYDLAGNLDTSHGLHNVPTTLFTGFIRDLKSTNHSLSFHAILMWGFPNMKLEFIINQDIVHTDRYDMRIGLTNFIRVNLWFYEQNRGDLV